MLCAKRAAAGRGARLINHGGALWRWFSDRSPRHFEELTLVTNVVHFLEIGEDPGFAVESHRVVFPRAFEQLVDDFEVFISVVVATIVFHLIRSEEHTSELQSRGHLVCRLLLEKKK